MTTKRNNVYKDMSIFFLFSVFTLALALTFNLGLMFIFATLAIIFIPTIHFTPYKYLKIAITGIIGGFMIGFIISLIFISPTASIVAHIYHLPSTTAPVRLNLSSLPTAIIINIDYGIPNQPETLYSTYVATTPYEQALGFANQTSYGYGNMLFLFKNDTLHCLSNKNVGTNMTLYWFNFNTSESGSFASGFITYKLQAHNTTPVCGVSNAVFESINGTMPEIIAWK
jgi:hypothetical protein